MFVVTRRKDTGAINYSGPYDSVEPWHVPSDTVDLRVITLEEMWQAAQEVERRETEKASK